MNDQRDNHGRDAKDKQDIENVGAHHVAKREIRLALERRHDGNRKLGRAGAEGDHREADHER